MTVVVWLYLCRAIVQIQQPRGNGVEYCCDNIATNGTERCGRLAALRNDQAVFADGNRHTWRQELYGVNSLQFLGYSKVHASPDEDEAVETGVADGALHSDAAGVAGELLDGGLPGGGHLSVGGLGGEVFQLQHV